MTYKLYYSAYCPFCQKVLFALRNKEHDIELLSTHEGSHQHDLIAGGGKGQVPCLRIEDESGDVQWMYESNDIIAYINQHKLAA